MPPVQYIITFLPLSFSCVSGRLSQPAQSFGPTSATGASSETRVMQPGGGGDGGSEGGKGGGGDGGGEGGEGGGGGVLGGEVGREGVHLRRGGQGRRPPWAPARSQAIALLARLRCQ